MTDDGFFASPPGGDDGDDGRRGRRKGKPRLRVPEDVVRREKAKPAPAAGTGTAKLPTVVEPSDTVRDDEPGDEDEDDRDDDRDDDGDDAVDVEEKDEAVDVEEKDDAVLVAESEERRRQDDSGVIVMEPVVVVGSDPEPAPTAASEAPAPIEVEVDAAEPTAAPAEDEEATALGDEDVEELPPAAEEPAAAAPAEAKADEAEPAVEPRVEADQPATDEPPVETEEPPIDPDDEPPVETDEPPVETDEPIAYDPLAAFAEDPKPRPAPAALEAPARARPATEAAEDDATRDTVPAPPPDDDAGRTSMPPEELDDASIEMDSSPEPSKASKPPPTPAVPAKPMAVTPASPDAMAFLKASRARRTRPWWEDLFSEEWLRVFPPPPESQMDREVEFIEQSLGVAPGGWLLDVACGTGHHAIGFARRGYQVVGIDLSLAMLARCAEEAQAAGQKITFLHSDMRELAFVDTYDGAYNIGTSFGYFDDEQNVATISGIHRSLKPKGLFFLEMLNRDYVLRSLPSLVWFEGDGCVCMEESSFNSISSRLHVRRTMILNDGTQKASEYSIRLYALHEIGGILHGAGFRVAEVSGSWATPGAFFGAESPKIMILAEKRIPGSRTSSSPTIPIPTFPDAPPAPPPMATAPTRPTVKVQPPKEEEEDSPERTWIPPASMMKEEPTPPPKRPRLPTRPDLPSVILDDTSKTEEMPVVEPKKETPDSD